MSSDTAHYYLISPLAYTGRGGVYTYSSEVELERGSVVAIMIGRRASMGVVLGASEPPEFKTKPVGELVDAPKVPAYLLDLGAWMADYYASSPSSVWSTMLPTGITKQRREVKARKPRAAAGLPGETLTTEQTEALASIRSAKQTAHLLYGVTGSGKTRIYLELAAEALAAGRSVIVLVPEIMLTPQIVSQFEEAFGEQVISSHSKLTEAERHRVWSEAAAGYSSREPRIIIGPRSCLFLPAFNLGLVVVDECHETSYKQEQHPRYNAIMVAAKLGHIAGARVVLGSATPGLSELFLAKSGRINLVRLTKRANDISHSQAKIIDLRNKELLRVSKFITQPLIDAITATLADGRQSLLYLNRRGSATSQVCGDCGYVTICPHCQLPLTFHADLMRLICHHCNYRQTSPAVCPECNGADLKLLGGGTKRIEAEVERLWPEARIARLDRDSATLTHMKAVYAGLKAGTIDIVIGTQMIAKGLDLPAIDTIGIISADTMLRLPDYTAAERTYQLLSQVSGRAGRGDRPGEIFIQTYAPEHPAIVAASSGDYDAFAEAELAQRELLGYPPYTFMSKFTVSGKTRTETQAAGEALAATLRAQSGLKVAGPAPGFIEIVGNRFHWIVSASCTERSHLQRAAGLIADTVTVDLDPINLL